MSATMTSGCCAFPNGHVLPRHWMPSAPDTLQSYPPNHSEWYKHRFASSSTNNNLIISSIFIVPLFYSPGHFLRRKTKVNWLYSSMLFQRTRPPCASIIRSTQFSPSPKPDAPPGTTVFTGCRPFSFLKIFRWSFNGILKPLSATVTQTVPSAFRSERNVISTGFARIFQMHYLSNYWALPSENLHLPKPLPSRKFHTNATCLVVFAFILLRQVLQNRSQQTIRLLQLQCMILQLWKRQYLVGQRQQMLSFLFHNTKITFFLFRLSVQTSAFPESPSHQDGTQWSLHIVNHGIREVPPHLGYLVLPDNDTNLIHNTDNDQYHNQHRGNQATKSYAGKSPNKDSESPLADSGYMPH